MFVKGDPEPGAAPSEELLEEMARFNEEMTNLRAELPTPLLELLRPGLLARRERRG